jgi:hypothetical protein
MARLKLGYDNITDARSKLEGTYCLYRNKAVCIRMIYHTGGEENLDNGDYIAKATYIESGKSAIFPINDPEFNCSDYNLGYYSRSGKAAWFFRSPAKQWQQGLKTNQLSSISSKYGKDAFVVNINVGLAQMLENRYDYIAPSLEFLKSGALETVPFHRNFAMSYEPIHEDYLLEYKGAIFGFTKDFENIEIKSGFQHLRESLNEVIRMRMAE